MEHTKEHPMTATTMTLVEFLRARLDEDEAVARAATEGPWREDGPWWYDLPGVDDPLSSSLVTANSSRTAVVIPPSQIGDPLQFDDDVRHIARHDPARVLAEVEAKRRIVERHSPHWYTIGGHDGDTDGWECAVCGGHFTAARDVVCADLRLLALPYADHPDYREEWRP